MTIHIVTVNKNFIVVGSDRRWVSNDGKFIDKNKLAILGDRLSVFGLGELNESSVNKVAVIQSGFTAVPNETFRSVLNMLKVQLESEIQFLNNSQENFQLRVIGFEGDVPKCGLISIRSSGIEIDAVEDLNCNSDVNLFNTSIYVSPLSNGKFVSDSFSLRAYSSWSDMDEGLNTVIRASIASALNNQSLLFTEHSGQVSYPTNSGRSLP